MKIRNFYFITGLSGGGRANLDGIPTAGGVLAFGETAVIAGLPAVNGGKGSLWMLQNRTDATGPSLQRPLDFDAVNNPAVWTQIK